MLKSKKVVLIMTDTQRWDMLNCYKETGLQTPNLDRMASEGVRCEYAYTTQPLCQPARAGIFTGQYPYSVGSWANTIGVSEKAHHIGERLEKHGIHTAYTGKWHLDGGSYFGNGVAPKGWDPDYWYDMTCYLEELNTTDRYRVRSFDALGDSEMPNEIMFAHNVSNKALDFLEKHNEEDFLLVVSYDEPHAPSTCPAPYSTMYKDFQFPRSKNICDDMSNKPEHHSIWGEQNMKEDKETCEIIPQEFFGCNTYVDFEIGRVLDAIDKYAKDAVVIYTSDHGDAMMSHNLYTKGPCTYDEVTRIPFIVKGAGIPKGVVDTNPISHINIAPTIMDIMGFEIPPLFPGKSLADELQDASIRTNDYVFMNYGRHEVVLDGFGGFQPLRAVYDGRYKLTINLLSTDELYDMKTDPEEMFNLIDNSEYNEIRNHLHDQILRNMDETLDPFRSYYWERRPWRKDAREPKWDPEPLCTRRFGGDPEFSDYPNYHYYTGQLMTREKK